MADSSRKGGVMITVLGAVVEAGGIFLMVSGRSSVVMAVALLAAGLILIVSGLGVLRRDRDQHALKKPADSGM